MDTLIFTILSSTVIATLITSIINLFDSKRHNKLKYISDERNKWRTELKEIAVEINNADVEMLAAPLVKLKVRINGYGLINKPHISKDSFAWTIMSFYDVDNVNEENINMYKDILIKTISVLLKRDWEKYKKEVNGWKDFLVENILFCALIITYSIYSIHGWMLHNDLFIAVVTILLIFSELYFIRCNYVKTSENNISKMERIMDESIIENPEKLIAKISKKMKNIAISDIVIMIIIFCIPIIGVWLLENGTVVCFIRENISVFGIFIAILIMWISFWERRIIDLRDNDEAYLEISGDLCEELYRLGSENNSEQ